MDLRLGAMITIARTNSHWLSAKLTGATLTTYIGGFRVGSETTLDYHPEENWAHVPVLEPSLSPTFDFELKTKVFLFENKLDKNNLFATITPETPPGSPNETPAETHEEDSTAETTIDDSLLDEFASNVRSGGPPKDGIPPIDAPIYVSVQEADEALGDDDIVFILKSSDPVKIFPQYILVFHEIVNEELDGEPISITYCPLTGSTICYTGDIQTAETTFGTSGKLINSNLVMYYRETDSYWPQILGTAINGPSRGEGLGTIPVTWTSWGLAKARYPDALILSEETGFLRNYDSDPYGSYTEDDLYYRAGDPFFPVINKDDVLPSKEVVVAIKAGGTQLAVTKSSVADKGVVNLELGGTPLVAIYDESLDVVRVYLSQVSGETLEFTLQGGAILDGSGSTWNVEGQAVEGAIDGESLARINHFDVMWFAWSAIYPETDIIQ